MKVLNTTSVFLDWGPDKGAGKTQATWPWGPVGFDYRPSKGLKETQTPVLEGKNNFFFFFWFYRRGSLTSQETEPKLPAGVGGPPVEGLTTVSGNWKVPLGVNPFGVPH